MQNFYYIDCFSVSRTIIFSSAFKFLSSKGAQIHCDTILNQSVTYLFFPFNICKYHWILVHNQCTVEISLVPYIFWSLQPVIVLKDKPGFKQTL